ncbi:MAG: efflux RND transporter permease subunit [Candidatus Eremiobacteraeota bacterium]|nr:efflux RND transporter permease subunit [Candidatus Eremiobacteraeota bacterium]MCW5871831.1 efflux RND transporter permease subunit [Candidatus Eremiobacteraeota bacterium]
MTTPGAHGVAGRLARFFLNSSLTPLLILVSLLLGLGATIILPREEEPQITVPMVDVLVSMPGASAAEVEQRLTTPLEKLVRELPGVEYVYSTSRPGGTALIVRFLVGTPSEDALVRLYSKIYAHLDQVPPGASQPLIKSHSIDDVPILALTFSSSELGAFPLRAVAAQVAEEVKKVADVSETTLLGGLRRQVRIELRPDQLAAYQLSPLSLAQSLQGENIRRLSGPTVADGQAWMVGTGQTLRDAREVQRLVVAVHQGRPVYLGEVATVLDGPEEPTSLAFQEEKASPGLRPAVTLAIAKRKGANATVVSGHVLKKIEELKGVLIPSQVQVRVTRDYGRTAAERSNELLVHMLVAVGSVTALMWLALGHRESGVVAVAIPVTLALTLATFVFYKFTLNRVTFFALIFSIGILVDDAIVVVENVVRHLRLPENRGRSPAEVVLEAVSEVGNPTILATLAVVAAILPMAFVSGLMGPYMLPIPLGASAAMLFSLLVAFTIVPWAALRLLGSVGDKGPEQHAEDRMTVLYRKMMGRLLHDTRARWAFLVAIGLLLLAAVALVPFRAVLFKMLPFDNKSELQILVDMPEGTPLENTLQALRRLSRPLAEVPEVTGFEIYAGTSAPYNFNGLVRHYFLRSGPHLGDLQVNLLPKEERGRQSHAIAKELRGKLQPLARELGAVLQVAEIPPGPPVLQTLVCEIYGPSAAGRLELAAQVKKLYNQSEGVVDVDWYVEDPQPLLDLEVDRQQAALSGLSSSTIAQTLDLAVGGLPVGLLHLENWREDVPIVLRLPIGQRGDARALLSLKLPNASGQQIPLAEVVSPRREKLGSNIYHKNMQPVVYVTGDVAGQLDSPLYSILDLRSQLARVPGLQQYFFRQPDGRGYSLKWDGEWQVTYEVFRDMGIAFAVVVVLIYALMVGWFESFTTPLVILTAIPFSMIGIMPAHWLLGAFFTATSLIGFIAGAGIVVRNSIILVDFIELRLRAGAPLDQAVIDAGAIRFRPMLLTAAAVVVGSAVMLKDPIFNGLAISLMAGEVASLLLSRTAVPVLYYMLWKGRRHAQVA